MICEACKHQIGLRSAWHPHSRLSAPLSAGASGSSAKGFQKFYQCGACKTLLVKGLNTGWAIAPSIAT